MMHAEYLIKAKQIKQRRKKLKLTQKQLADMCNCSDSALHDFECGNFLKEITYLSYYELFKKKLDDIEHHRI